MIITEFLIFSITVGALVGAVIGHRLALVVIKMRKNDQ